MIKILMVCLGNICRSPLAQSILQSKLSEDSFYIDSAGTSAYHIGELPDSRSIDIAKQYAIDISQQRARAFELKDFDLFDFILVMDASNYQNLKVLARDESDLAKVDFILNYSLPNENLEVPDPYYGGDSGFNSVFQMLDTACEALAKELNT